MEDLTISMSRNHQVLIDYITYVNDKGIRYTKKVAKMCFCEKSGVPLFLAKISWILKIFLRFPKGTPTLYFKVIGGVGWGSGVCDNQVAFVISVLASVPLELWTRMIGDKAWQQAQDQVVVTGDPLSDPVHISEFRPCPCVI